MKNLGIFQVSPIGFVHRVLSALHIQLFLTSLTCITLVNTLCDQHLVENLGYIYQEYINTYRYISNKFSISEKIRI
jgi:hypothetical protein